MRKMALMLTAAVLMSSSVTVFAQPNAAEKDECLLASKNCMNQVDDIHKRIHRLQKEIKKGKRVYSSEDLRKLHKKLTETQDLLDSLEKPGR